MFPCVSVWPANGSRASIDGDWECDTPVSRRLQNFWVIVKKHRTNRENAQLMAPQTIPFQNNGTSWWPSSPPFFRSDFPCRSVRRRHVLAMPASVGGGSGDAELFGCRIGARLRCCGGFLRIGGAWKVCLFSCLIGLVWFSVVSFVSFLHWSD